jgi:hypothetical protein
MAERRSPVASSARAEKSADQSPTRPGDILQVESEVLEVTPSRSRPDRGMVTVRSETFNQRGEVVQMLTAKLVVPRRASLDHVIRP